MAEIRGRGYRRVAEHEVEVIEGWLNMRSRL